jgi:hypothetical protein
MKYRTAGAAVHWEQPHEFRSYMKRGLEMVYTADNEYCSFKIILKKCMLNLVKHSIEAWAWGDDQEQHK